jgi:hypothetical protein
MPENKALATPKEKLYTVTMKCAMCLRVLGMTTHVEKNPGIKIDYNECVLHRPIQKYGAVYEWQPEW